VVDEVAEAGVGRAAGVMVPRPMAWNCKRCSASVPDHRPTCHACVTKDLSVVPEATGTVFGAGPAPSSAAPDPLIGKLLAGCVIDGVLGEGAMGLVYRAHRVADLSQVVVKVVRQAVSTEKVRARFAREGAALLRLAPHPNVVRAIEVGDAPPCLVLEFIEGRSLLERVLRDGPLPWDEAARIARDVARGLAAVHRQGVVHRDVKPDNIRLTLSGQPKLVDFGLARDEWRTALTAQGAVLGTPAYMAPELWRGQPCGAPTDVFALGATLYELVTGVLAFQGTSVPDIYQAVLRGRVIPMRRHVPDAPFGLELVVAQALAPEPRHRYRTADELAEDLERVLHGLVPSCPALELDGRRFPLVTGTSWTVGSAGSCPVAVDHASVDPEHAEVVRTDRFAVRDLGSRLGTTVDGARAEGLSTLSDGAQVGVGAVTLRFHDPRSGARPVPILEDVERVVASHTWVEALARGGQASAAVSLLERVVPDAWELEQEREELQELLVDLPASFAAAQRQAAHELGVGALAALERVSGGRLPTPDDALRWWDRARTTELPRLRTQLVASSPSRLLRLRPARGPAMGLDPERGLDLDVTAHVQVQAARHAATILRLDRRLLIRGASGVPVVIDGVARPIAFLDPGARLQVGDESWTVEVSVQRRPTGGECEVSPPTFWALAVTGHPAATDALLRLLQPPVAVTEVAMPGVQEVLAHVGSRARRALTAIVGLDLGSDPAPWQEALRPHAGPRVAPRGFGLGRRE
jgi:hypothetical protein